MVHNNTILFDCIITTLGHFRNLFPCFRLFNCRWLDSNCGSVVLEATALPTAPQPLPLSGTLWCERINFVIIDLHQMWCFKLKLKIEKYNLTLLNLFLILAQYCFINNIPKATFKIHLDLTRYFYRYRNNICIQFFSSSII